jgi:hypothetical protein
MIFQNESAEALARYRAHYFLAKPRCRLFLLQTRQQLLEQPVRNPYR